MLPKEKATSTIPRVGPSNRTYGATDLPSIFRDSLVDIAAEKILPSKPLPKRFLVLFVILPSLPDVDVISLSFGIPYEHFWDTVD